MNPRLAVFLAILSVGTVAWTFASDTSRAEAASPALAAEVTQGGLPDLTPGDADDKKPPEGGKPETGKPDPGKPGGGKPDGGKPETGKPDPGKPDGGKPEDPKPTGEGTPEDPSTEGSPDGTNTVDLSKLSPEERFVRENLKDYLHPSTLEFLQDGRVKMAFNFETKSEEHNSIFTLPIGGTMKDVFRWSVRDEEYWVGSGIGLRISDKGMTHLKAWFVDDVEAEITYIQTHNQNDRHTAAIVFTNAKGQSVGSNYGSQCVTYNRGAPTKALGKVQPVIYNQVAKLKLVVRGGTFEAFREGSARSNAKYSHKTYSSGQIGFLWGGRLASIIPSLSIVGKIDYKRMSEQMKGKVKS